MCTLLPVRSLALSRRRARVEQPANNLFCDQVDGGSLYFLSFRDTRYAPLRFVQCEPLLNAELIPSLFFSFQVAGTVVRVGEKVTEFKVGDRAGCGAQGSFPILFFSALCSASALTLISLSSSFENSLRLLRLRQLQLGQRELLRDWWSRHLQRQVSPIPLPLLSTCSALTSLLLTGTRTATSLTEDTRLVFAFTRGLCLPFPRD